MVEGVYLEIKVNRDPPPGVKIKVNNVRNVFSKSQSTGDEGND